MAHAKDANRHIALSLNEIVCIFGFGLYYTWYLCLLLWIVPQYAASNPFGSALHTALPQMIMLCGAALVTTAFSSRVVFAKMMMVLKKKFALYVSSLFAIAPAVMAYANVQSPTLYTIFCVMLFLTGISVVSFFASWENTGMEIGTTDAVTFIGLAFCFGTFIFVLTYALFPTSGSLLAIICIIGSTIVSAIVQQETPPEAEGIPIEDVEYEAEIADKKNQRTTARDFVNTNAIFLLIGVESGFALSSLSLLSPAYLLAGLAAGLLMSLAFISFFTRTGRIFSVITLERLVSCAVLVAIIVSLAFPTKTVTFACSTLIVMFWLAFRSLNGGLLMRHAIANGYSTVRYLAASKICSNAGIAVGFAITSVTCLVGDAHLVISTCSCLIAIGIIVVGFLRHVLTEPTDKAAQAQERAQLQEHPSLIGACEVISKLYQLSPRESEILHYLARGRSARYIAQDFMISEYTVKSHIGRIYKKMNVHSKQELIDLIESTPPR